MPFDPPTPESLLGRSDSKNPASTCRGLTTAGKPCRRALTASLASNRSRLQPGVVAVVEAENGRTLDAAYFCWQHKDQAREAISRTVPRYARPPRFAVVNERTSIDSLVERLGVAHIVDSHPADRPTQRKTRDVHDKPAPGPASHSGDRAHQMKYDLSAHNPRASKKTGQRPRRGFFASLCCFSDLYQEDEYYEIVRHVPRSEIVEKHRRHDSTQESRTQDASQWSDQSIGPQRPSCPPPVAVRPIFAQSHHTNPRRPLSSLPPMAVNRPIQTSSTQRHLSLIPHHVSPGTAAALLAELAKPISPHDTEGYIYIFWLTDSDKVPDREVASSVLGPRMPGSLSRYACSPTQSRNTILLKIGRANNVHRRMTEWTQQCGYALSLLRWYPYVSSPRSSPVRGQDHRLGPKGASRPSLDARSSSDQVKKVPHVHRVERLIHLELADKRIKKDCTACGKEHREWFEIEATVDGVKAVDEVVRRWVGWAEGYV